MQVGLAPRKGYSIGRSSHTPSPPPASHRLALLQRVEQSKGKHWWKKWASLRGIFCLAVGKAVCAAREVLFDILEIFGTLSRLRVHTINGPNQSL
jgi:hypothetical protein